MTTKNFSTVFYMFQQFHLCAMISFLIFSKFSLISIVVHEGHQLQKQKTTSGRGSELSMDTKVSQDFADKYYMTGQKYPYPCILWQNMLFPHQRYRKEQMWWQEKPTILLSLWSKILIGLLKYRNKCHSDIGKHFLYLETIALTGHVRKLKIDKGNY